MFRIGNRVVLVKHASDSTALKMGSLGIVRGISRSIAVEWDKGSFVSIKGHNLSGIIRSANGWNVKPECLRLYNEDLSLLDWDEDD